MPNFSGHPSRKLASILILTLASVLSAAAQTGPGAASAAPEYVSAAGVKYYAQADERGTVAEAEKKLAADQQNLDLLIALGRAQGGVWRFRDAIETFTRGIQAAPNDARCYVLRGHRYISTRQFEKALTDLKLAAELNPAAEGLWYHLGLAHYLVGEFDQAAAAYQKSRDAAKDDNGVVSASDWMYMALRRAGKNAEAEKVLERITPEMKVSGGEQSYFNRLLLYKGLKKESDILPAGPAADMAAEVTAATIGYGVANWNFYNGRRAEARKMFEAIVQGKSWAAFGSIAAEAELARQ